MNLIPSADNSHPHYCKRRDRLLLSPDRHYWIQEGIAALALTDADGYCKTPIFYYDGRMIVPPELPGAYVDVLAVTDCMLRSQSKGSVSHSQVLAEHSATMTELTALVFQKYTMLVEDKVYLLFKRLAETPLAAIVPEGVQIKFNRMQIAMAIGCSRESAGKAVAKLKSEGRLLTGYSGTGYPTSDFCILPGDYRTPFLAES